MFRAKGIKGKAQKLAVAVMLGATSAASIAAPIASAGPLQTLQDRIGTDRVAHFGVGYVLSDLCGQAKMTNAERTAVVVGAAALKEGTDDKWNNKDFVATVLGGLVNIGVHGKF